MAKSISSRNTKAQILEAYDELYEEHDRLQARLKQLLADKEALEKRLAEARPVSGAVEKPAAPPGKAAEQAYTIEAILGGLAALRAGFGSAVSALSARLTAEVGRLEALRQQVEAETQQLQALHGLDVGEDTLGALIREYEERSRAFQEEERQTRETFQAEMAGKQEAWQKEQDEHARLVKDQRELLRKERQRDEAEYKYQLDLARTQAAEAYAQKKKRLYGELEELVGVREKALDAREGEIAARDQEYEEVKARVEAFPRELESAARRAEREGTDAARKQAKVRYDLLAKEEEGERRVSELEIQSLEETIQQQAQEIQRLSAQLEVVVRQDQDLAIKAIQGASHETSFQSIREIALEQAKNPQKVK